MWLVALSLNGKPVKQSEPLLMNPTVFRHIFGGTVTVYGFGVDHANLSLNWSLKGIESGPDSRQTHAHVFSALASLEKTQRVYGPSPDTFNSDIVKRRDFFTSASFALSIGGTRALYRGVKADGYGPMLPSDAFVMSAADCALIVVKAGNYVFAAHAGRNSLFDRQLIDNGAVSKTYPSVVDAIMAKIPQEKHQDTEVFIGFTISKGAHFEHPVGHPTHGKSNQNLLKWIANNYPQAEQAGENFWKSGQLDMKQLIRQQFEVYGVERFEVDAVCTFSDTDTIGRHLWFSQRRTPGMRNLFAVTRNS